MLTDTVCMYACVWKRCRILSATLVTCSHQSQMESMFANRCTTWMRLCSILVDNCSFSVVVIFCIIFNLQSSYTIHNLFIHVVAGKVKWNNLQYEMFQCSVSRITRIENGAALKYDNSTMWISHTHTHIHIAHHKQTTNKRKLQCGRGLGYEYSARDPSKEYPNSYARQQSNRFQWVNLSSCHAMLFDNVIYRCISPFCEIFQSKCQSSHSISNEFEFIYLYSSFLSVLLLV